MTRLVITSLGLVAMLACEAPNRHRDVSGASPGIETPVGPIPGPGESAQTNPNPYSDKDPVVIADGFQLFKHYNCSGCHGEHAGGGMGPSLRDMDWLYGDTDAQIFDSIAEGRGHGMPSWGTKLPEDQVWKLVTYIRSLRTNDEPDKPYMAAEPEAPPEGVK
jgi:cytochrome c oxidase cbb3-type subunit 3